MSLRFCAVVIGLFVLIFLSSAGGSMAVAQQDSSSQGEQIMTPISGPSGTAAGKAAIPRSFFVKQLNLRMYEAAKGNLSLCSDDKYCLKHAKMIQSLRCAADVCDGTGSSKKPLDCFKKVLDQYSKEDQDQINSSMCLFIESPSTETGKTLSASLKDINEDELVGYKAYILALKGSGEACEDYIKNYVGPYGPKWNLDWYRAMSGCRILAGNSTTHLEEKGFDTWFGALQGVYSCSDIFISEMRKACSAPGAASPVPIYGQ